MAWTFTKHEQPQRLTDIMQRAWRLYRARPRAGFALCLRVAWIKAKRAAGLRLPPRPQTLCGFVRSLGGLRPDPELRHMGAPLNLLNWSGHPLDFIARLATDAGYDVNDDVSEFLERLRDDIFGLRVIPTSDVDTEATLDQWEEYHFELMEGEGRNFF